MAQLGISRDGVGTTNLNGAFDPIKPLRKDVANAIQSSIDRFYQRFLEIVAESREMTTEQVHEIAQGRVWSGIKAQEIGLVDKLGALDDAVKSAADLAGVVSYKVSYIEHQLSDSEQLLKSLFGSQMTEQLEQAMDAHKVNGATETVALPSNVQQLINFFNSQLKMLSQFNDPAHVYAHCLCELN
jgi:protease IV